MGVSASFGVLRASSSLSWCQDARWPGSEVTSSTSTASTTRKRGENRRHRHSRTKSMCCSISFFFQDFFGNRSLDQGITSTFKPYSLRNVFHKATEATDSDSSHGSEKRQLQTFWREFTSLDAINNLCDSLGRGRNNNINRSLEEVDSTPHG